MERSGVNDRTSFEATRSNNRGSRMLIAIGTFVGLDTRTSNVVAIIREQWCSTEVYLYAARCMAARKSRDAG